MQAGKRMDEHGGAGRRAPAEGRRRNGPRLAHVEPTTSTYAEKVLHHALGERVQRHIFDCSQAKAKTRAGAGAGAG